MRKIIANEQYDLCRNEIRETELFDSMKSIKNSKNPGKEGLTKNFFPKLSGINCELLLWKKSIKLSIQRPYVFHKEKLSSSSLRKKTRINNT